MTDLPDDQRRFDIRALAAELPTAPPSEAGMSRLERLTQFFKADTDAKRLPGAVVMIARHGKGVYDEAFGVRDPATGQTRSIDVGRSPHGIFLNPRAAG